MRPTPQLMRGGILGQAEPSSSIRAAPARSLRRVRLTLVSAPLHRRAASGYRYKDQRPRKPDPGQTDPPLHADGDPKA